jgi:hypothetical protein
VRHLVDGSGDRGMSVGRLVLFGVVGFERGRGGASGGIGRVAVDGKWRAIRTSQGVQFEDAQGWPVMVTSHRAVGEEGYTSIRAWAPMNAYLATPRGQADRARRRESEEPLVPPGVVWQPARLSVDGEVTDFELTDLGGGWWVAVGCLPDALVTVDSRGVAFDTVSLERIPEHFVPAMPEIEVGGEQVRSDLDERFERVPFGRVRNRADYWALHSVEVDHVENLARLYHLAEADRIAVQAHWIARIEAELAETMERLHFKDIDASRNSRIARRLQGRNALYQVWSNTIGPGAKCWFGNRYTPIRHHTFRLRWRP